MATIVRPRRRTPRPAWRALAPSQAHAAAGPTGVDVQQSGAPLLPGLGGRRVLVVDDEPSIRLLCSVNLAMEGVEVVEAADGAEALERAAGAPFDLVLLDVMLPDIGGHEVARRLQADGVGAPIVFLSARADPVDLEAGYEAGGVDYITKPFDPTALGARLGEVLGRVDRGDAEAFRRARLAELRARPA
ncbi:MAG TPA: response regulator [Gaiellaceae bacterium]|nr:response regulator [Gaiellaceae bacterium]